MKKYVLNYYPSFRCAAGACKHTCCAGWELNIDAPTLCAYQKIVAEGDALCFGGNATHFEGDALGFGDAPRGEEPPFPIASALKSGINFKKSQFKRDKAGRCAFLNEKGLCELILHLGEDCLCQVCRDHPRFRSFFDDREELGLGFCCEEAARLILSFPQTMELNLVSDDGVAQELDFNQANVLKFRQAALEIVQNRAQGINERLQALLALCRASVTPADEKAVLRRFKGLERLDKAWTRQLKALKTARLIAPVPQSLSLACEQFLANGLYRYLSDAEDTAWVRARALCCVFAWWVVQAVALQNAPTVMGENAQISPTVVGKSEQTAPTVVGKNEQIAPTEEALQEQNQLFLAVVEGARAFSCEVDYSQENLDKLFAFAYRFIRI